MARGIEDELALPWWIPYTLRKWDITIFAINSQVKKKAHKYGVKTPTSLKDAHRLDAPSKDTRWFDTRIMEMKNVGVTFEILPNRKKVSICWKKVGVHLICNVKMDFTWKARWVKDGHRIPDLKTSAYARVVSSEGI